MSRIVSSIFLFLLASSVSPACYAKSEAETTRTSTENTKQNAGSSAASDQPAAGSADPTDSAAPERTAGKLRSQRIASGTRVSFALSGTRAKDEVLLVFPNGAKQPCYWESGEWHSNVNLMEGATEIRVLHNRKEQFRDQVTLYTGRQDFVRFNDQGRLEAGGKAFFPAGFSPDYRTRFGEFEKLLEQMQGTNFNLLRFLLSARLALHEGVPPGEINSEAAENIDRVMRMCRKQDVRFWIVTYHRSGAGPTAPFMWSEHTERIMEHWAKSTWNKRNGGFMDHPREAYTRPEAMEAFKSSFRYIVARWAHDPMLACWEIAAECYLMDGFRENPKAFEAWQQALRSYLDEINPYQTIVATGDGSHMHKGQLMTFAPKDVADCWTVHVHPPKKKLTSMWGEGNMDGIFNHTSSPQLAHIAKDKEQKPWWCGALGYGPWVDRQTKDREEFGRRRTMLDVHAVWEYIMGGHVGSGLTWDHEGHLSKYNAVRQIGPAVDFYATYGIVGDRELDFAPQSLEYSNTRAHYLVSDTRSLGYVYDKSEWYRTDGDWRRLNAESVRVPVKFRGEARVQFYDTFTSQVVQTTEAQVSGGEVRLSLPPFKRSLAVVVEEVAR
jgi:hypothetical protein